MIALGLGEADERGLLRFETQARAALASGTDPGVGDCGFHKSRPFLRHTTTVVWSLTQALQIAVYELGALEQLIGRKCQREAFGQSSSEIGNGTPLAGRATRTSKIYSCLRWTRPVAGGDDPKPKQRVQFDSRAIEAAAPQISIGNGSRLGFGGDRCIRRNASPSVISWRRTSLREGANPYNRRASTCSAVARETVVKIRTVTRLCALISRSAASRSSLA